MKAAVAPRTAESPSSAQLHRQKYKVINSFITQEHGGRGQYPQLIQWNPDRTGPDQTGEPADSTRSPTNQRREDSGTRNNEPLVGEPCVLYSKQLTVYSMLWVIPERTRTIDLRPEPKCSSETRTRTFIWDQIQNVPLRPERERSSETRTVHLRPEPEPFTLTTPFAKDKENPKRRSRRVECRSQPSVRPSVASARLEKLNTFHKVTRESI